MNNQPNPQKSILKPRVPDGASVKIIGLGGVGGIVARYAAVFLASAARDARLALIDGDTFQHSNATRMLFMDYGNKAAVLRQEMLPRFEQSSLSLIAIEKFVTPKNVRTLIRSGDYCLLCVDNHASRKMVNDWCAQLRDICLISGGNDGVGEDSDSVQRRGTYGNVQVFIRRNGENLTPSLAAFHPEIAAPADKRPDDLACTELVASSPQVLFANLAAASGILNAFWLHLCSALHYSELSFDIAEGLMRPTFPVSHLARPGSRLLQNEKTGSSSSGARAAQHPER
jgi:molybdopterin/thiamine biosynthesis adenylyltransferase